jgi:hypothetical protein
MSVLLPKINLFFSFRANRLFIIPSRGGRIYCFYLPQLYFYRVGTRTIRLLFLQKFFYSSLLAHLRYLMRRT